MAIEQHDAGLDAGASQESRRPPDEARSTPLVTPPPRSRRESPPDRSRDREPPTTGAVEPVARVTVAVDDRDADVLLDIPRLQVDELGLDLEATALLRHVRLDVKDLQLGLVLRADLEHLAELAAARGDEPSHGRRAGGRLASAAYDRLFGSERERERAQLGSGPQEEAAEQSGEPSGRQEQDDAERPTESRFGRAAKEGGKAAAVAAAGLAGGALVESRLHPLRKHGVELPAPLRRRESAPRAALRHLTRALPG
jgi:hypothetical protein